MSMDLFGIIVFAGSSIVYLASKSKPKLFLFTAGIGAGLLIASIWLAVVLYRIGGAWW